MLISCSGPVPVRGYTPLFFKLSDRVIDSKKDLVNVSLCPDKVAHLISADFQKVPRHRSNLKSKYPGGAEHPPACSAQPGGDPRSDPGSSKPLCTLSSTGSRGFLDQRRPGVLCHDRQEEQVGLTIPRQGQQGALCPPEEQSSH